MNVGILSPRSNAHPSLTIDFFDGIKLFLKKEGLDKDVALFSESIGFGGTEKEVYEKAERLLLQNDVDVLVAYIDLKVIMLLEPLIFTSGKLFIIVNPGANYPYSWLAKPNVLFLTLHDAFLCGLAGKLAAQPNGIAVTATTFYDCGYLHVATMLNNYIEGGANILYHYINKQQPYNKDNFEIAELVAFLSQAPDVRSLLCVFDSLPGSFFFSKINAFERAKELQLFVSPMMLQQQALDGLPYQFSVTGFLQWSPQLQLPGNTEFLQTLQQANKKPSLFSLLGWEAALVLQQVYEQKNTDPSEITGAMKNIKLNSPRGTLQLDEGTNYFTAPAYHCTIAPGSNKLEMQPVETAEAWKKFTSKTLEGINSGWTNTYLCY